MTKSDRPNVAIAGGGPAGLMAAEVLSRGDVQVTVYDAMPTVGRKFLMAGRGGLNLTHSEALDAFLARYGERKDALAPAIEALTPSDLRMWCEGLGQETFVGTSGRVFPRAMKASGLLRAWLRRLDAAGVTVRTRHRWTGWDETGRLEFTTPEGQVSAEADAALLALGGASWPRLGSDGAWVPLLAERGVGIAPISPSNCGFEIAWSDHFRERFAGAPLKGIALSHAGSSVRGEAVVTATGLEGGAVYALSAPLRDALERDGDACLVVDLKPDASHDAVVALLRKPRGKQSLATFLRKAVHLSPVAIALLQEAAHGTGTRLSEFSAEDLARAIKAVRLEVTRPAPIGRAISTAGGVSFDAIDPNFMLRSLPGIFVAGEMLDWEAPTGGYLLQACFATGAAAARGIVEWLATRRG